MPNIVGGFMPNNFKSDRYFGSSRGSRVIKDVITPDRVAHAQAQNVGVRVGTFSDEMRLGIGYNFPMPDPNANPQSKSRVSVDSGGRILLPKKVRQRLGLAA